MAIVPIVFGIVLLLVGLIYAFIDEIDTGFQKLTNVSLLSRDSASGEESLFASTGGSSDGGGTSAAGSAGSNTSAAGSGGSDTSAAGSAGSDTSAAGSGGSDTSAAGSGGGGTSAAGSGGSDTSAAGSSGGGGTSAAGSGGGGSQTLPLTPLTHVRYSQAVEVTYDGTSTCGAQWQARPDSRAMIPMDNEPYDISIKFKCDSATNITSYHTLWSYGSNDDSRAENQGNGLTLVANGSNIGFHHWWFPDNLVWRFSRRFLEQQVANGYYHTIRVVWNGTTRQIIFDGEVKSEDTPSTDTHARRNDNFCIGSDFRTDRFGFRGKLKELKVRANTSAMLRWFNAGLDGGCSRERRRAVKCVQKDGKVVLQCEHTDVDLLQTNDSTLGACEAKLKPNDSGFLAQWNYPTADMYKGYCCLDSKGQPYKRFTPDKSALGSFSNAPIFGATRRWIQSSDNRLMSHKLSSDFTAMVWVKFHHDQPREVDAAPPNEPRTGWTRLFGNGNCHDVGGSDGSAFGIYLTPYGQIVSQITRRFSSRVEYNEVRVPLSNFDWRQAALPDRAGSWVLMATVYKHLDHKHVFYMNGDKVGESVLGTGSATVASASLQTISNWNLSIGSCSQSSPHFRGQLSNARLYAQDVSAADMMLVFQNEQLLHPAGQQPSTTVTLPPATSGGSGGTNAPGSGGGSGGSTLTCTESCRRYYTAWNNSPPHRADTEGDRARCERCCTQDTANPFAHCLSLSITVGRSRWSNFWLAGCVDPDPEESGARDGAVLFGRLITNCIPCNYYQQGVQTTTSHCQRQQPRGYQNTAGEWVHPSS